MECSFRIFSQWRDILNLFQLILFHRNQYKWQSYKTYWWNPGWLERHHKNGHHGLALCYNLSKVNIIEVIEMPSVLEVLSIVLEIERETILLVIMYYMPGPLGSFIDDFISLINELPTQHRMLIAGDFYLDQMLPEHVAKVNPLIQSFNLSQRSQYLTHIHGGILDLVFDTSNSNAVSFLPSPFSDHFVLFFQIWCIILYRI